MRFNVRIFRDLGKFAKVYLQKFLFLFLSSRIVLYIVPLFGCGNGVVEVLFGKSLPDLNGALLSAVKPQAIERANRKAICSPRIHAIPARRMRAPGLRAVHT